MRAKAKVSGEALNRTIVGWKRLSGVIGRGLPPTLNRTIVGWKPRSQSRTVTPGSADFKSHHSGMETEVAA